MNGNNNLATMSDLHIENKLRFIHRERHLKQEEYNCEEVRELVYEKARRQMAKTWIVPMARRGVADRGFGKWLFGFLPEKSKDPDKCKWKGLWEGYTWNSHGYMTSCFSEIRFDEEFGWSPVNKGMKYCCFCGKSIDYEDVLPNNKAEDQDYELPF